MKDVRSCPVLNRAVDVHGETTVSNMCMYMYINEICPINEASVSNINLNVQICHMVHVICVLYRFSLALHSQLNTMSIIACFKLLPFQVRITNKVELDARRRSYWPY